MKPEVNCLALVWNFISKVSVVLFRVLNNLHTVSVQLQCVQSTTLTPTSASGTITSMNYPNYYINNANCAWLITALSPNTVRKFCLLFFAAFLTERSFSQRHSETVAQIKSTSWMSRKKMSRKESGLSQNKMLNVLRRLKAKTSRGPDGLPNFKIKTQLKCLL